MRLDHLLSKDDIVLIKSGRGVLFSFEGAFYSFKCFASASSSEFKEVGFLDARLQRSECKVVVSFLEN